MGSEEKHLGRDGRTHLESRKTNFVRFILKIFWRDSENFELVLTKKRRRSLIGIGKHWI